LYRGKNNKYILWRGENNILYYILGRGKTIFSILWNGKNNKFDTVNNTFSAVEKGKQESLFNIVANINIFLFFRWRKNIIHILYCGEENTRYQLSLRRGKQCIRY
jgi:hypothetical protein